MTVFESEDDVRLFLKTLSEAAQRADLVVHAYVLMPTHYHMLLETPGGNLVDGMKWLQVMLAAFIKEHYPLSNRSISKLLSMGRPTFISRCRSLAVEKELDRFKALSLYLKTEVGGREKQQDSLADPISAAWPRLDRPRAAAGGSARWFPWCGTGSRWIPRKNFSQPPQAAILHA